MHHGVLLAKVNSTKENERRITEGKIIEGTIEKNYLQVVLGEIYIFLQVVRIKVLLSKK